MAIFGSGFGVLLPMFLGLLPLGLGFLIYVYRRRGQGQRIFVASTLILKKISKPIRARRNFFPPPRFFWELLLISLIGLAAAGLYRDSGGKVIAIVIDNSLSMSAVEPADPTRSILSKAIDRALDSLGGMSNSDKVTVFDAVSQVSEEGITPSDAAQAIRKIRFGYFEDDLDSVISKFANQNKWNRVLVYSDKLASDDKSAQRVDGVIEFVTLRSQSENQRLENLAITGIEVRPTETEKVELVVAVSAFATGMRKVKVVLSEILDGREAEIGARELEVRPEATGQVIFSLNQKTQAAYKAKIFLSDRQSKASNSIIADDEAFVVQGDDTGGILLVSDESSSDLGLSRFRAAKINHISPQDFYANQSKMDSARALIFHRTMPTELPNKNAIFIMPNRGNKLITTAAVENVSVTRWNSTHPLMTYASVAALKFSRALSFKTPLWAEDVLSSTAGPVYVAGETNGNKYAFLGFEIFPFEGKNSPITSVITLNLVKWISGLGDARGWLPVGRLPLGLEAASVLSASDPLPSQGPIIRSPGIYLAKSKQIEKGKVAVNFLSSAESNTITPEALRMWTSNKNLSAITQGKASYTRQVASLCLVFLIIELLLGIVFSIFKLRAVKKPAKQGGAS